MDRQERAVKRGVKLTPDNVRTVVSQLHVKIGTKPKRKTSTMSIVLEIVADERVELCNYQFVISPGLFDLHNVLASQRRSFSDSQEKRMW